MRECIRMAGSLIGAVRNEKIAPLGCVVADDFVEARQLLVDALDASGRFEVVAAVADGASALSECAARRPDLALLDLAMPGLGGLDVIGPINEASPATRIIVVSGFPGRGLEELTTARGAAGYVRKGLSVRKMIDEIISAAGVLDLADLIVAETRHFGRDLTAAREARRFLGEVLERWDCQAEVDTLQILISEVVTNAVTHAGSAPEVAVRHLGDRLRVEVGDDDSTLAAPVDRGLLESSGRGLRILDSAAQRWGMEPRAGGGKVVWFEVPVFGAGQGRG